MVEASASLNLSILANNVVIHGRVRGPVVANEIVDVGPTGQVIGDIKAVKIIVRDGATIQGRCEMAAPALPEPRPDRMPPGQGDPNATEHVPPAADPVAATVPGRFPVVNAKPLRPPSARMKP